MLAEPIDDILEWSEKLAPWKQDALRRLAIAHELTAEDTLALLHMVKHAAGFRLPTQPKPIEAFVKAHFGGGKHQPIILKGISNVENVNRLIPKANLSFCQKALTIVYGRNGSGKSGFVRILRTACRTRIENANKLKVLADVYGSEQGPQTANILIGIGSQDVAVPWSPGQSGSPELMQVSVFDTASAQLYVDGGNQIRFLPFGLALPHRLNSVCLLLKGKLEAERALEVGNKVSLTTIFFTEQRPTRAQRFDKALTKSMLNPVIDAATRFEEKDQLRLEEISAALSAGASAVADVSALLNWIELLLGEYKTINSSLTDDALSRFSTFSAVWSSARQAADLAATELFTTEPLAGIGSETWRALWAAARDYSVNEAYVDREFPVVANGGEPAACVLCHQPLLSEGVARMQRFQKFMDDTLDAAARKAAGDVADAIKEVHDLPCFRATDFSDRLEQVRRRDPTLAQALSAYQGAAVARRLGALARLRGEVSSDPVPALLPMPELTAFAQRLQADKEGLLQAGNSEHRTKLADEKAELEDRKVLAANKSKLTTRRDLLILDDAYAKALADVQTRGITQRANELLDKHLTAAVVSQFDEERECFDITHLKVGLTRKSGQTKAEFETDPNTTLTRATSEILSEGEQRALALAGFLTEVALTDGSGPVIIDDPVSSLDRDRSAKVANRLAEEATKRQVVVFTHDIVFFNELCKAADDVGIEPVTIALFSDKDAAGKVDPAGMVWKGLTVGKRIGRIKNDAARLASLYSTSRSEYEYQIKNLYGRLRDTYERVVEEIIFQDIIRRGTDVIQTQKLRYVHLSDALAIRFHEGMTRANTFSHDNPAADTVLLPDPKEFAEDIDQLGALVADLLDESQKAEKARPQMKPKR